jgi:hypothetical protein
MIPCVNYELCKSFLPEWCFSDKKLCSGCKGVYFENSIAIPGIGELEFVDSVKCLACHGTGRGAVRKEYCSHTLCLGCFRCYFFSGQTPNNKPAFPYSREIEKQYELNPNSFDQDLLIQKWEKLWTIWDEERQDIYEEAHYNRTCPMCPR